MTDVTTELRSILDARRPALTEMIIATTSVLPNIPGIRPMGPDELAQMVNGFFMLVDEALSGRSETREFYLSTVMPSLRAAGSPAKSMISGCARVLVLIAFDLAQHCSAENRKAAQEWLATFFADYLGEIAAVWSDVP